MKKLIFLIAPALAFCTVDAQSLTPEVVAGSGAVFSNSTLSLEWTLGEIMIETYMGDITLTQGFHQPRDFPPVGTTDIVTGSPISLYPNPASGNVSIRLPYGSELLGLLSATGRNTGVHFSDRGVELTATLAGLPAGIYFLRVRLAGGQLATKRLVVYRP